MVDCIAELLGQTTVELPCEKIVTYEILSKKSAANLIVLVTKQFLYRWKRLKQLPEPKEIISEIQMLQYIERKNAVSYRKVCECNQKWKENIQFEDFISL